MLKNFKREIFQFDLTDILLFIYITAFFKQCLTDGYLVLVWTISCILSSIIIFFKKKYIVEYKEKTNIYFLIIVVIPLAFIFFMRMLIPDVSFDVISSRLFSSDRLLKGALFIQGDYFPVLPQNPMPEIITGIYRSLLGYRLGTIVNLFSVLWVAILLNKILLEMRIKNNLVRCFFILFIVFTENTFFEINNYLTDLLSLPLLLEAVIILMNLKETKNNKYIYLSYGSFLLGICIAFKLTNIVYLIPIYFFMLYFIFLDMKLNKFVSVFLLALTAVLPSIPSFIYLYNQTGNPIFPFYNDIFKSPYYDISRFKDLRWGPKGFKESFIWPIKLFFVPNRISELPFYSGRISFSFLICLVILFFRKQRENKIIMLAAIFLSSSILWSFSTGYIRYAIFSEILGGLLCVYLLKYFYDSIFITKDMKKMIYLTIIATIIIGSQLVATAKFTLKYEWSGRQTFFDGPRNYISEAKNVFVDYSLQNFLSEDTKNKFKNVDVWILTTNFSNSFQIMSKTNLPTISLLWYTDSSISKEKFKDALKDANGKRMFTLIHKNDLEEALKNIKAHNLEVGQSTPVQIPYFSNHISVYDMLLIEVLQKK